MTGLGIWSVFWQWISAIILNIASRTQDQGDHISISKPSSWYTSCSSMTLQLYKNKLLRARTPEYSSRGRDAEADLTFFFDDEKMWNFGSWHKIHQRKKFCPKFLSNEIFWGHITNHVIQNMISCKNHICIKNYLPKVEIKQ